MEFDLQPTLKGNLIEIRPLRREDFDALFAAASDPLIWEQHPENDRYTREVFQRYFVVGEKNFRSQKALEKIGARFLRKEQRPAVDGTMTPNLVFFITR